MIKTRKNGGGVQPSKRFGLLEVLGHQFHWRTPTGDSYFVVVCRCDCGNTCVAKVQRLNSGRCSACEACGDQRKLAGRIAAIKKHGETGSVLWVRWAKMKQRCEDKNAHDYPRYGGRGITVCQEWSNQYTSFRDWALANGYKRNLQIDRIDNDKGYCPQNCRFVTARQQANNKRNNVSVEIFGETKTISQWARDSRCAINRSTFATRLRLGWSPDAALTQPAKRGLDK